MPPSEQLGFIGLGIMGYPMAENLLKAGHPLVVYNRTRKKADALAKRGAQVAENPADLARRAKVIFLCLGDSASVEEACNSILSGVQPGSMVADCTTISPSVSRAIAEKFLARKIDFLDAPCTGSKAGATNASLTFMVGGEKGAFDRALPYLSAMGQKIIHVGAQ